MQNSIRTEIKRLAQKSFSKENRQKKTEEKYRRQFEKRTGTAAGIPKPSKPPLKLRHFDAAYCARNANFLAKTLWHKVLNNTYEPEPAINYQIPKPDGSKRSIMAFSIPDAALANVVLRRARDRNLKRLSPSSYAYHPDKNVFDAILSLKEFKSDGKLFAVQIDFEKYFDNIPSRYLKEKINNAQRISLTPHERFVFDRFLHHRFAPYDTYSAGVFQRRFMGTPQGSSVSLLLANLANHDLDTALSAASGKFVRFADDVVALCSDYSQAQELERCFVEHCRTSGLKLNSKKSPGIAVISDHEQEMRTYKCFDYLGYRFTTDGLTVPNKTISKIQSRISRLCHIYLLKYLVYGYDKNRASTKPIPYDWDLLGLIYELRNSLYGGLSEEEIMAFLIDGRELRRMKGLMGFYCLIDDPAPLRKLDGWMLSMVRRALVKRNLILNNKYGSSCPTPNNGQLARGDWLDLAAWRGNVMPEARMPSLVRGWRAARKHFFTFGLEHVEAPTYDFYSDVAKLFDY